MTLQLLLIYGEILIFFFISVECTLLGTDGRVGKRNHCSFVEGG